MALKGSLKDFSLTQLLNLIRLARKTGGLVIQESGAPLHIYCQDGRLTHVAHDGHKTPLADMMVRTGRVTEGQMRLIRPQLVLHTDKELALRLMDLGMVSQDDVVQALRQQMLEMLYPVFGWTKGSFYFDPAARPSEDEITISMELDTIIMEGGRRIKETTRLQETIPTLDVVPRLSTQQDAKMRSIKLSVDQWKIIAFVNGRNTLRQIGNYTGMSEFQVRKVFQEMVAAGLVELGQAPGRREPERTRVIMPRPMAIVASPPPAKSLVLRLIDRIRRL